ncbi:phytanoyl-CoA dioxygenase family protein [Micromonospora rifamycinica]|uniref:Phytanoyl-CoA dioxygenase (PhyH) n=1 Tax=Micromonospora rifamycinica TaxID=291594 RepID=A0A1C5IKT5_9ACTN|nr:phytanoyl-CoA dioxygenase family protein [Micromonospora rifamycinica]SCG58960.1 Phytanoyl-CoA dioxygenase (PhyH) [Micromonospora rifamycinica]
MSSEYHSTLIAKAIAEYPKLGYSILPGFFTEEELAPVLSTLHDTLPGPDAFVNGSAEFQESHRTNYRAGLVDWPYPSTELSLFAVHPKLIELSEILLGSPDIRMYNGHAWVKYAGASYDQDHHRDYRGHTPVIASQDPEFAHVQYFILLSDVDEGNGPPMFVDNRLAEGVPMHPHLAPRDAHPEFYEAEIPGVGPRGTVIAFDIDTFHRATDLKRDGASRYMLLSFFRRAEANWVAGPGRGILTEDAEWISFVENASRRQLDMLGFPAPDHRYWTDEIKQAYVGRYPHADRSWLGLA